MPGVKKFESQKYLTPFMFASENNRLQMWIYLKNLIQNILYKILLLKKKRIYAIL